MNEERSTPIAGPHLLWRAPPRPYHRRARRGSVVLLILVIIVVLSVMIVQFTEKGMAELAAEGHYVERDRLRLTAYSALETTLAVLADVIAIDGGLTAPAQGWSDPLATAGFEPDDGVTATVSFIDESGKLSLNSLDEGTLYLLFTEMGFEDVDALRLQQSLLDWIDEDDLPRLDGAEDETYEVAEWPYTASNQPIRRLEELAVVEAFRGLFFDEYGRPNASFRSFSDTVSLYTDGTINANSVTNLGLRSFAGMGDPQIQALRDYMAGADRVPGTADDRYFAAADEVSRILGELPQGASLGVGVSVLRVRVEIAESGGGRFALEAVVQPGRPGGRNDGGGGRTSENQGQIGGTAPGEAAEVSYPFVFLELLEDVGQNQSIANPADEELSTENAVKDSVR